MTNSTEKRYPSITPILLVVIIPIICLAPFVTKAFHIDDTLFLWTARQIHTDPADFYGFTANWYWTEMPMSSITKNPPLASYYIALVALLFGWNEVILHLAFLIPAVGFSLGTYYLARALCPRPHLAALIAVITPVFLVSSTNIMCDTIMLAFYVWAAALWLRGLKEDSSSCLLVAATLIAFSALTKYFGLTLVPLLLVYSLAVKRRLGPRLLFLAIPVLILIGYQWLTYALYGRGLLSVAASYAVEKSTRGGLQLLTKTLTGLAFTGGCLASVAFYVSSLWSRRFWILAGVVLGLSIATLLAMGTVGQLCLRRADGIRWGLVIQFAVFITAGFHILALAAADLWEHRDASSLLLFLWIVGTFFFTSFVNWMINARTVFPMVPAAGILVMRRFDQRARASQPLPVWRSVWPLIPAACIALSVTWADFSLANCQRSAARMINTEFKDYPHTLWFQGHWGFQYYMESHGGKVLDYKNIMLKQGDILIIPSNNYALQRLPRDKSLFVGRRQLTPSRWLGTNGKALGAGFYGVEWGPLPFAVGATPPEEYEHFLAGDFDKAAGAINNLKKRLAVQGDIIDNAIAKIQEALKLNPGNPALHYNLGDLYKSKGELDEAIEQYQKALSIEPRFIRALNNLAIVYTIKSKYDKAISLFKKIIELRPDNAGAYYNIACIYARQDRIEESISWLKKAIERGYRNWDLIKTDKDLENIRGSSYYEEIIRAH